LILRYSVIRQIKQTVEIKYSNCSVVIPAYNEEESMGSLLEELIKLALVEEIIVVNDCSTDSTKEIVQRFPQVILIDNPRNMGNGSCAKKGILKSTKEYVLLMDADGQHPPSVIPRLVNYAIEHDYDLVVASRKQNSNVSGFRTLGNRMLEAFASYLSGTKIDDLTSGFRVFKRSSVMKILHLFPARYSYPTTSVLALLALGYNVDYLRIPEITVRKKGHSGIHPVKDFFRFIKIMLRIALLYGPSTIFLPFSFVLFLLGVVDIGMTLYFQHNIQEFGVIAIILSFVVAGFAILGEQLARIRIEIGMAVANEIEDHNSTFHENHGHIGKRTSHDVDQNNSE
jgi:glycosyltransferase involved in cell wall biosynthesis